MIFNIFRQYLEQFERLRPICRDGMGWVSLTNLNYIDGEKLREESILLWDILR